MPAAGDRVCAVNDAGHVIGGDHHRAKLTDHDVDLILELRDGGLPYRLIAAKFEVSKAAIADICKGRRRSQTPVGQKRFAPPKPRVRRRPARPDEFDVVPPLPVTLPSDKALKSTT